MALLQAMIAPYVSNWSLLNCMPRRLTHRNIKIHSYRDHWYGHEQALHHPQNMRDAGHSMQVISSWINLSCIILAVSYIYQNKKNDKRKTRKSIATAVAEFGNFVAFTRLNYLRKTTAVGCHWILRDRIHRDAAMTSLVSIWWYHSMNLLIL